MGFLKKKNVNKEEEEYEEYGSEENPKYNYETVDGEEIPQKRRQTRPEEDYQTNSYVAKPIKTKQQVRYSLSVQPQQIQVIDNMTGEAKDIDPSNSLLVYQLLIEIKNDLDRIKGAVL